VGEIAVRVDVGAVSLEEVLIGGGGMKLDQHPLGRVGSQCLSEFASEIGLPSARRPVEDYLTLVFQQFNDLVQAFPRDKGFVCEVSAPIDWVLIRFEFLTFREPVEKSGHAIHVVAE